jgi:3-phenylpropionate/trans-cinnamate dioxygenase ferredoxin reductase subunit
VVIGDQVFFAPRGDVLLDAALLNGIDIPHDCRSGHCGTCRVRVLDGLMIGGECGEPGAARACQGRILSDLQLAIEALPQIKTTAGRVSAITERAREVVEISIEPAQPVVYLPGQYLRVQFRGYPARCYSPTASMDDFAEREFLHLQMRRIRGGRVSAAVGNRIREGHRVKIQGPFGAAFLRPASLNRLVLVASGTGFAPIWSIAVAAIQEHRHRHIAMVIGARTIESLYMIKALCVLARYPNVKIIPVVDTPQNVSTIIRTGSVADHIPELSAQDTVHACGPPRLVETVSRIAAAAGAQCYCDPFVPQDAKENTLSRALDWFNGVTRYPPIAQDVVRRDRSPPTAAHTSPFSKASAFAERAM